MTQHTFITCTVEGSNHAQRLMWNRLGTQFVQQKMIRMSGIPTSNPALTAGVL